MGVNLFRLVPSHRDSCLAFHDESHKICAHWKRLRSSQEGIEQVYNHSLEI